MLTTFFRDLNMMPISAVMEEFGTNLQKTGSSLSSCELGL